MVATGAVGARQGRPAPPVRASRPAGRGARRAGRPRRRRRRHPDSGPAPTTCSTGSRCGRPVPRRPGTAGHGRSEPERARRGQLRRRRIKGVPRRPGHRQHDHGGKSDQASTEDLRAARHPREPGDGSLPSRVEAAGGGTRWPGSPGAPGRHRWSGARAGHHLDEVATVRHAQPTVRGRGREGWGTGGGSGSRRSTLPRGAVGGRPVRVAGWRARGRAGAVPPGCACPRLAAPQAPSHAVSHARSRVLGDDLTAAEPSGDLRRSR